MLPAKTLMIQGTGSGVGKTVLVAALCRIFKRSGFRVAPFKAQNMSNNSFVAEEGGEIARAQAMQAECVGIAPSVHMSPILLKPHSDSSAQVVVQGKSVGHMKVHEYHRFQRQAFPKVKESLRRLRAQFDVVLIEGAGSPAEVNLVAFDIANMKIARLADSPVILVGDIERGGVFASLYGTFVLLKPSDRKRIKGFIINKFRGDAGLLKKGIRFLEEKTGVPVLGVVPYIEDLLLDEEDSLDINPKRKNSGLDVAILKLPHISNFTDFKALELESGVHVRYIAKKEEFRKPDLLIIPGTKSTVKDLEFLRQRGFFNLIKRFAGGGGVLLGVCGGFQMLGERIEDHKGIEGDQKKVLGLGLLPVRTRFEGEKVVRRREVRVECQMNGHRLQEKVRGYEIHMGRTGRLNRISGNSALFQKGSIFGTYLHGLFDNDSFRTQFLRLISQSANGKGKFSSPKQYAIAKEKSYRTLVRTVKQSIRLDRILSLLSC